MMFYNETDFRETPIGEIPKDWDIARLEEVCEKITDGTHKTPNYVIKGVPFLSTQNIMPFKQGFDFSQYKKYISLEEHRELIKRCKPEKGDLLVSKCGTIGRTKLIDAEYEFSIFVGLALLKIDKEKAVGEFLEQLLNFGPFRKKMETGSPGSTRKTLTINAIANLRIPFPGLSEQKAIAEVLSIVDDTIQKTDEIIAKLERLKKGLMQELLTKGIGHNEFKYSEELDYEIPKDWKVVRLGDIANINRGKFAHRPRNDPRFYGGTIPFIQTGDIGEANGILTNYSQTLNEEGLRISKLFEKGTIVISIAGNIGDVGILDFDACFPDSVVGINVRSGVDDLFLMYLLQGLKHKLSSTAPRSTQRNINYEILGPLKLPLPPFQEQQQIASVLSTVGETLEVERQEKAKLQTIKQGLMNLLLTGKIRVKVS